MSTPEDWKIPSATDACAGCGSALEADALVTVELVLDGEGPRRRDLCATCGEAVDEGFFWRQRRHERGDERPVVDYAFLREMFGRMLERPEEVYRRLSYLVGLVLIRKRHLRLKGFEQRDGQEVMVVTRGKDHPDQIVPAPFLSAEDMVDTRELLTRLMASDLPEGDVPDIPGGSTPDAEAVQAAVDGEASGGTDAGEDGSADETAPELN